MLRGLEVYRLKAKGGISMARAQRQTRPVRWCVLCGLAMLSLVWVACGGREEEPVPEYTSTDAFVAALEAAASSGKRGQVDRLWSRLVASEQVPYIRGEEVAFLYRGRAESVSWVGDFTEWQRGPALAGRRVGESDIWLARATFPGNARLEYRIAVDGTETILDPANPREQWGGFGPNSVVAMLDYVFPSEVTPREGVAGGELSQPLILASARLGYEVGYQVYTPADYEELSGLATLYVVDAHEYGDARMGSLPTVLDNLITDGTVEPIVAVLVDPRDPETGQNRRQEEFLDNSAYVAFLAKELVPLIDRTYRTDPAAGRRAILGDSYGGVNAAACGLAHPEVFGLVAMQSPAFVDSKLYEGYRAAERLPLRFFVSYGEPPWDFDAGPIIRILEAKGYPVQVMRVPEGHSWGQWRSQLDDLLMAFFPGGS
jgi:enterochelin esterase-like enzyme